MDGPSKIDLLCAIIRARPTREGLLLAIEPYTHVDQIPEHAYGKYIWLMQTWAKS